MANPETGPPGKAVSRLAVADEAGSPAGAAPDQTGGPSLQHCRTSAVLNQLSDETLDLLRGELSEVAVRHGDVLITASSPLEAILFPLDGLYSVVRTLQDGSTFEVDTAGQACRGGISFALDDTGLESDTVVLMDGTALAIRPSQFAEVLAKRPELRVLLDHTMQATGLRVQRSEGCNVRHAIDQRLARWLLNAVDEAGRRDLAISQETLAGLLGVRRAGVNQVLMEMRRRRLIETGRRRVMVIDRAGLAIMACECYAEDVADRAHFYRQRRPAPGRLA